jgi:tRNA pseudouridine55 synthase
VDKPVGPSSHAVVVRIRRALRERRIGHTGTLDPAASGVLPLVLGRATRLARFLSASDKAYDAVIRLGVATTTLDAQGVPVGVPYSGPLPDRDTIAHVLETFRGTFTQQPPAYSAKKVDGRRSYAIARRAERSGNHTVAPTIPAPVLTTAYDLALGAIDGDRIEVHVECSAGFYVRSLAHDLGQRLGTGAHLASLRRTRSGDLTLDQCVPLADVEEPAHGIGKAAAALLPLSRMLPGLPAVVLTDAGVRRALNGCELRPPDTSEGIGAFTREADAIRLIAPDGDLVGIANAGSSPGLLHPLVVLM